MNKNELEAENANLKSQLEIALGVIEVLKQKLEDSKIEQEMTKYLADELVEAKKQLKKEQNSRSKADSETYFKVYGFQKIKTEAEWNKFN